MKTLNFVAPMETGKMASPWKGEARAEARGRGRGVKGELWRWGGREGRRERGEAAASGPLSGELIEPILRE